MATGTGDPFPSGTKTLFCTSAAPTGWTKISTYHDYMIRVVSGTPSSGGSVNFSSCFVDTTWNGTISADTALTGNYTLTTADLPTHNHRYGLSYGAPTTPALNGGSGVNQGATASSATLSPLGVTTTTGGGGAHAHPLTNITGFAGSSVQLNVKYIDVILASRD